MYKSLVEIAIERKYQRIKEAAERGEEIYFLEDIESGFPYEVTKKQYDDFHNAWKECQSKIDGIKGCIVYFGT